MPIFEIETDQGIFEIDSDREPTQAEALQAISGQTVASSAIDTSSVPRGGIGVPVSRDQAKQIAAQRLVAREREAGFRPGDLLLRSEAQQLANQAGIPLGDVGEVVSTSQFAPTLQGDLLKLAVGAREAGSQALFGVPGAVQSGLEDLILNEAQKRIIGSQALKERSPEAAIAGGTIGQLTPTRLVGGALTSAAPLSQRLLRGAGVGVGIGALVSGSGAVEEGGLNTDLQTLLERAGVGGALGAAFGGAIPASQALAGRIRAGLRESAEKNVAQALLAGGGTKEAKAITERLTPEILDRPISETYALSRKGLATKSEAQKQLAGEAIEAFGTLKGDVNPQEVVSSLEKLKSPYVIGGKVIDPEAISRIEGIQAVFEQYGNAISKEDLREIRRTFDGQVREAGGFFGNLSDKNIVNIKKTASNSIRNILAQNEPDLAKLNQQYNFWSNLNDVATQTLDRTKPQMGFVPTLATVAGAASGTGLADVAVRAVIFRGIAQATRSPGWKLLSAKTKNSISNSLIDRNPQASVKALRGYDEQIAGRLASEIEQVRQADKDGDVNTLSQFSQGFIQEEVPVE